MELLVYIALGLFLLYFLLNRPTKKGKQIPGPTGWPIVGNIFDMRKGHLHEWFTELAERYGDIFQVTAFGKTFVVLNSARMVRTALCTMPYAKATSDRADTFFGNSVLFGSKGFGLMPKGFESPQSELKKTFATGLRIYGDGRNEFETVVMSELKRFMTRLEEFNGKEFDMVELMKRSLSNVLSILLNGEAIKDDDKDWNMFWELDEGFDFFSQADTDALLRIFPLLRLIPGKYKERYDALLKATDKCLTRMYYDTKATYKEGKIRGLVDFFIEQQQQAKKDGTDIVYTDDTIKATVLETVIAALLAVTSSLSATFLCLVNYPQYQTKIQEELKRIIGTDRLPKLADRQDCVFTEAVCLEFQRYYTIAVLAFPRFCEPNIEFEGYDIPANSLIISNQYYIHHDKKIWGDPWTFRPERWLDENGDLLPEDHALRKSWMPFGAGRRKCAGQDLARNRIFLYMSTLLQNWTFVTSPEHVVSCDPRAGNASVNLLCRPISYMCRAVPTTTNCSI